MQETGSYKPGSSASQSSLSLFERNLSPEMSRTFPQVTGIHVLTTEPRGRSLRTLVAIFGSNSQLRDLVLRFFDVRIHWPDGFLYQRDGEIRGLESHLKCPRCGSRRVRVAFTILAAPL